MLLIGNALALDSVEERQFLRAWHKINEESRMKSTAKAKLIATNQQEK